MAQMKYISCDLETYSDIDLQKCGVYRYAESPNFEILLFGYSVDGGEVQVIDLACGEKVPQEIINALTDDTVTKWAFNAAFERVAKNILRRRQNFILYPSCALHDIHDLSHLFLIHVFHVFCHIRCSGYLKLAW